MQPKYRVKFFEDLLQYGLPKLQSASLEIDFNNLSDEDLDAIISKVKESSNE